MITSDLSIMLTFQNSKLLCVKRINYRLTTSMDEKDCFATTNVILQSAKISFQKNEIKTSWGEKSSPHCSALCF